jgi:hypothetical protein
MCSDLTSSVHKSGFPNANALRALVRKGRGNGELLDRFLISALRRELLRPCLD